MKNLYLDTSAIINLARNTKEWQNVDDILHDGRHALSLSTTHLLEFSKGRKTNDYTAIYLDTLPHVNWVIPPWLIWKEEVGNALNYILSGKTISFNYIYDTLFSMLIRTNNKYKKLEHYIGQPIRTSDSIDFFKQDDLFKENEQVCIYSAERVKDIRENAIIWKNLEMVLARKIRDYWPNTTQSGLKIPFVKSYLEKILKCADICLPSLVFTTQLERIKYSKKEHIEPNDFIDEFHSSYAPYFDALIMHDRSACKRIEMTGSVYAKKVAYNPNDLIKMLNDQ